ncbi:hypothetical protein H1R20_g10038, partial [Candolleomyces eurysporus]
MATVKALVDSAVEKNPIVIFSKSWCPYCKKAKNLLATEFKDIPATIFELDERNDGSEIQNYLLQKTQQRTVPNIFIKQEHIGGKFPMRFYALNGPLTPQNLGFDDTSAAFNSGKLAALLKA